MIKKNMLETQQHEYINEKLIKTLEKEGSWDVNLARRLGAIYAVKNI